MLQGALQSLTGFFSRSFAVGYFLPAFFGVLLNGLFLALASKGIVGSVKYLEESLNIAETATAIGIAALIAAFLAVLLAPTLPAIRRALEGDLFVGRLRARLSNQINADQTERVAAREGAQLYVARLAELRTKTKAVLVLSGRPQADAGVAHLSSVAEAESKIQAAKSALNVVSDDWSQAAIKDVSTQSALQAAREAAAAAEVALKQNPIIVPDKAFEPRLAAMVLDIRLLLDKSTERARTIAADAHARCRAYMVSDNPQPTRLGNLRARFDEESREIYGAGVHYLWSRIRLVIGQDEEKFEAVEQAQTQINSALMMLVITILTGAGWLIWLVWRGSEEWKWLLILLAGLAIPAVAALLYRSILESQMEVIEATKATIDLHRFKLLDELHVEKPDGHAEEIELWGKLEAVAFGYAGVNLPYKHPV